MVDSLRLLSPEGSDATNSPAPPDALLMSIDVDLDQVNVLEAEIVEPLK
jgi:hypothetical protein